MKAFKVNDVDRIFIPGATTADDGLMSAADKAKLDSLTPSGTVSYTMIAIHGNNGSGLINLAGALFVYGPFAPAMGDKVISILQTGGFNYQAFDDAIGFASQAGVGDTLRQFDASDLSADVFIISFARTS